MGLYPHSMNKLVCWKRAIVGALALVWCGCAESTSPAVEEDSKEVVQEEGPSDPREIEKPTDGEPEPDTPSPEDGEGLTEPADSVGEADGADGEQGPLRREDSPVRVYKAESSEDLCGGIGAQARAGGAWIVENEVARFYIQDTGVAAGLDLYGGNVIDAVRLDEAGEPGPDLFREMFPIVGFKVPDAQEIDPDWDSDGHPALRVKGTDQLSNVVDLLDSLVAGPAGLEIETEYGMEPGVPALRMRTRIRWPEDAQKTILLLGELLAFGKYQQVFTEEGGFGELAEVASLQALVTQADGASYGWVQTQGNFSLLAADASNTAVIYNELPPEDEEGWLEVERWLVVGDGSPASVLSVIHGMQDRDVVTASGVVKDWGDDSPVAGITVTAIRDAEQNPTAVNQAVTDELGQFSMTLERGQQVQFVPSAPERDVGEFVFELMDEDRTVELEISPEARIQVQTNVPTRVTLEALQVQQMVPWLGESKQGGFERRLYSLSGDETFSVRPGSYTAYISRGPEFSAIKTTLSVNAGEVVVVDQVPVREVETPIG